MEPGTDYTPDSPSVSSKTLLPKEKTLYREMIGSLMYIAVMTRPDIAYAVSTLSQYTDADWASNLHRHSISGFAFFVGCGAVSWSAKKQHIITL
jgi:cytochrome c oxidase assembly factor CtaG